MALLVDCVRKCVARDLCALASAASVTEFDAFFSLLVLVRSWKTQGRVTPMGMFFWRKYDETPMKLRLRWCSDDNPEFEPQAKLVVVERAFGILLQLRRSGEGGVLRR